MVKMSHYEAETLVLTHAVIYNTCVTKQIFQTKSIKKKTKSLLQFESYMRTQNLVWL